MLSVRLLAFVLPALALAFSLLFAVAMSAPGADSLYQEHNLLENAQLAALACCLAAFAARFLENRDRWERWLYSVICLLTAAMLCRESDLKQLIAIGTTAQFATLLFSGIVYPTLLIYILSGAVRLSATERRRGREFLLSTPGLLLSSALMLLFALLLGKSILRLIEPHRLIEEIAELSAYLFMLIAGFVSLDARERITPLQQAAGGTQP